MSSLRGPLLGVLACPTAHLGDHEDGTHGIDDDDGVLVQVHADDEVVLFLAGQVKVPAPVCDTSGQAEASKQELSADRCTLHMRAHTASRSPVSCVPDHTNEVP